MGSTMDPCSRRRLSASAQCPLKAHWAETAALPRRLDPVADGPPEGSTGEGPVAARTSCAPALMAPKEAEGTRGTSEVVGGASGCIGPMSTLAAPGTAGGSAGSAAGSAEGPAARGEACGPSMDAKVREGPRGWGWSSKDRERHNSQGARRNERAQKATGMHQMRS